MNQNKIYEVLKKKFTEEKQVVSEVIKASFVELDEDPVSVGLNMLLVKVACVRKSSNLLEFHLDAIVKWGSRFSSACSHIEQEIRSIYDTGYLDPAITSIKGKHLQEPAIRSKFADLYEKEKILTRFKQLDADVVSLISYLKLRLDQLRKTADNINLQLMVIREQIIIGEVEAKFAFRLGKNGGNKISEEGSVPL